MVCHGVDTGASQEDRSIVLVGNPNVGKSVLFGALTGRYAMVSNYPGTTVEVTRGAASVDGERRAVVDTPGVNSLLAAGECERVTRSIVLDEHTGVVVLVADAKNLDRAVVLATQLVETEIPFVLALNMDDEARKRGIEIDDGLLSEILGVEVRRTVATRREGVEALVETLERPMGGSRLAVAYGADIEGAIERVVDLLPPECGARRARAVMLLGSQDIGAEGVSFSASERARLAAIRRELQAGYDEPLGYVVNRRRVETAREVVAAVCSRRAVGRESVASILGRLTIHPVWGVPVLFAVLYLLYWFVGQFGAGTLVGYLEGVVFGEYINRWARDASAGIPLEFVRDLIAGEYGLVTMALSYGIAIILPIVGTFFLAFSLLEDSGYLPRLAVMANRPFKAIGLNGKAVVPMVLGLGCDTMATMTTRILDTRKERLQVTLLLALAVPCSAQLGVILGIMGGLGGAAVLIWGGVLVAVLFTVGYLAARVLPGEGSDFIQELPPLRLPRLSNVLVKTLTRMEWYLKEVLPLFVIGTALLFTLDRTGMLSAIEAAASPLVTGILGLPEAATQTFLMGFLRRDYGAAGLFKLVQDGQLNHVQALVSLVVITLFMPCIANFLMIVKEFGLRVAVAVAAFVTPLAFVAGGLLNATLKLASIGL